MPVASPPPPLDPGPAKHTYIFADLVTDANLGIVPVNGSRYNVKLNSDGTHDGTVNLGDAGIRALGIDWGNVEAKTSLYIDRAGTLVWGGIIWNTDYDSDTHLLTYKATDFAGYLKQRNIFSTLAWVAPTEQAAMVRFVIGAINSYGIAMQTSLNDTGVYRTLTVYDYELKTFYDFVNQLSQLSDGFDWAVDCTYGPGQTRIKTLNIGYPHRGRPASTNTPLVWEYPGKNIVRYNVATDGTKMANTTWETGAGSGSGMIEVVAHSTDSFVAGYPWLDQVVSRKDIRDKAALQQYANYDNLIATFPVRLWKVQVRADMDPMPGTYMTGDWVRLRIVDERFPAPGLDAYYRIVEIATTVPDDGAEIIVLTLGAN